MKHSPQTGSGSPEPELQPDQALIYITDMLEELSSIAKASRLEDVETLLRFTLQAVRTRKTA